VRNNMKDPSDVEKNLWGCNLVQWLIGRIVVLYMVTVSDVENA
jgi:hypothetical protein